jgi:hypothetical protein
VFNVFLLLVIAYIPILLGRAVAGEAEPTSRRTSARPSTWPTLLGANVHDHHQLVVRGQPDAPRVETGTLDMLYLTPGRV